MNLFHSEKFLLKKIHLLKTRKVFKLKITMRKENSPEMRNSRMSTDTPEVYSKGSPEVYPEVLLPST